MHRYSGAAPIRPPLLTHWTKKAETVAKILRDGFQMPAHNRKVMTKLRRDLKLHKEPQAFGMVCFTDLPLAQSGKFVDKRPFGIVMSPPWSLRHGARKVRYVSEDDPDFADLRRWAEVAAAEVDECIPYPGDAGWQLAHQNINAAAWLGTPTQVHFLHELQFTQGAEYSWESEWRIVQSQPLTFIRGKEDKAKRRDEILADFQNGWGRPGNAIRISVDVAPEDVFQIWCPVSERQKLQEILQATNLDEEYWEHCTPYGIDLSKVE